MVTSASQQAIDLQTVQDLGEELEYWELMQCLGVYSRAEEDFDWREFDLGEDFGEDFAKLGEDEYLFPYPDGFLFSLCWADLAS